MFMLLLSGYTFNLNNMNEDIRNLTELNPMRWLFQALMTWQYEDYTDGLRYLQTYGYGDLDKNFIFEYLRNFYYFSGTIYVVMMLPSISRLNRRPRGLDGHLEKPRPSLVRDDSTATVSLNFRIRPLESTAQSPMQEIDASIPRGPNVEFSDITYTYEEFEFSFKKVGRFLKTALDRCSGHFKNGCLNAIIGASGSGRSTLLHILAGSINPQISGKHFSGSIKYGGKPIDNSIPGWQRNAFVESKSIFLRDITVLDTVGYAWQFRSGAHEGRLSVDADLVEKVLCLVQLDTCAKKKTKYLTPGEVSPTSIQKFLVYQNLFVNNCSLVFII
jgi:ABC-type lipoprotein export system ATPase subunit